MRLFPAGSQLVQNRLPLLAYPCQTLAPELHNDGVNRITASMSAESTVESAIIAQTIPLTDLVSPSSGLVVPLHRNPVHWGPRKPRGTSFLSTIQPRHQIILIN